MNHYITYYENQIGSGSSGVRNVFIGSRYQRGSGIGSFFAGLARSILPLFTSGLRAVGKEALRGGISVLDDIGNNVTFKDSLKTRFAESRENLKDQAKNKINEMLMRGSGYKTIAFNNALQSLKRGSSDRFGISSAHIPSKKGRKRSSRRKSSKKTGSRKKSRAGGKRKKRRTGSDSGRVTKKKSTNKHRKKKRATTIHKQTSRDIFG